jgi:hypothetical protein
MLYNEHHHCYLKIIVNKMVYGTSVFCGNRLSLAFYVLYNYMQSYKHREQSPENTANTAYHYQLRNITTTQKKLHFFLLMVIAHVLTFLVSLTHMSNL